jgi:molybdate transport system substrate-binding protein
VDVAVGSSASLDGLLEAGQILPGHTCALARSGIGLAVRAGACKPEVGTAEALTRALLACRSIAISTSASALVCGLSLGAEGWMPRAQGLEGVEHRLR